MDNRDPRDQPETKDYREREEIPDQVDRGVNQESQAQQEDLDPEVQQEK